MRPDAEPTTASGLLAEPRRARLRAVRDIELSADTTYALRRVLYTDRDAEVRTAAARRLGAAEHSATEGWLLDALGDSSPLVRDAVIRALAKRGTVQALPVLRASARADRMWWVRRAALYAIAAIAGAGELPVFKAALDDPFWRVRHAAVKVLAVLGARDLEVRAEVIASPPSRALAFLRAAWGPAAVEAPGRAQAESLLPEALLDPDPAVVTARLVTTDVSPVALVELLCDPHAPLRLLAAQRIARSGDRAAYEAALDWLEEPRIPHVADTVERLLDGLGDPAADVARHALARPARAGGVRWAIGWIVATKFTELYDAALAVARTPAASPELRRAALSIAREADLVAWLAPELVDLVAIELHERRAFEALAQIDTTSHPQARALQVDAAARLERWAAVEAALGDPHHGPRAIATRWLIRAGRIDGTAQAADPDPAVREAALTPAVAPRLVRDPDPFVCRAAMQVLVARWHGHDARPDSASGSVPGDVIGSVSGDVIGNVSGDVIGSVSGDVIGSVSGDVIGRVSGDVIGSVSDDMIGSVSGDVIGGVSGDVIGRVPDDVIGSVSSDMFGGVPGDVIEAARAAHASPDPWIRAQACRLPLVDAAALAAVIAALDDGDEMVRSAAQDALAHGRAIDDRLRALLPALPDRTMAYAWLCRRLDDEAGALARAALAGEGVERARAMLSAIAGIEAPARELQATPRISVEPTRPAVAQRRFERAGFDAAPLAISGAFDLAAGALAAAADAGVDLWFWEPAYHELTRFLRARRRQRMRVIAGSYHAEAAAIEQDVDRALRRLRRDTLDVFLLFWSRSAARVDAAAFAMLERIQRTGKVRAIGFSTHDRELARTALEASPWDTVMIRHSAAHPGIEAELLPTARAHGASIITFSALCYGRMVSGPNAPSPADCYRYSLSQPGVTACISAPRRYRELVENLDVLRAPTLADDQLAALRAHGVGVRAESQRFNTLMRQPTRDAAAAARELLAAELPPQDEIEPRRLPRAGASRGARTSLGKARRR